MLELLMDPLGLLVITFFAMSIVSIIGVVLLFLSKNEKLKKGMFYFLAVWGCVIAYCGVLSEPGYMTQDIVFTLASAGLGIVGFLIQLISKKENKFQIARILVAIAVIAGMINCFLI